MYAAVNEQFKFKFSKADAKKDGKKFDKITFFRLLLCLRV